MIADKMPPPDEMGDDSKDEPDLGKYDEEDNADDSGDETDPALAVDCMKDFAKAIKSGSPEDQLKYFKELLGHLDKD